MSARRNPKPPKAAVATAHSVDFEFHAPDAQEVCVAGTFNDWHPNASPMVRMGGGRWAKQFALPPGSYEYLFVVDGQWTPDPNARESVPNPYGGQNSRISVA